jgi:pyridoxine kinase
VISAMGIRCSVLPTAVLSTHTGFPNPEVLPLTEYLNSFSHHWETVGIAFDAITTGYMADAGQAGAVLSLIKKYKAQGSTVIVDPAMGDHGKLYSRLANDHIAAMAKLCAEADILLPNVTEAAMLTGTAYQAEPGSDYLQDLTGKLINRFGAKAVVITGVTGKEGTIGFCGRESQGEYFSYYTPVIPRQCHGTGDLYSAVFTGNLLRGCSVYDSGVLAADFVRRCVAATETVSPHGVAFESQIPYLFA